MPILPSLYHNNHCLLKAMHLKIASPPAVSVNHPNFHYLIVPYHKPLPIQTYEVKPNFPFSSSKTAIVHSSFRRKFQRSREK